MPAVRKKKKIGPSAQVKRQRPTPKARRDKKATLGMVPTDGDPIRKKIKQDYEKTQRKLEQARGDFDRFHKEDVPKFAQWLNANFGTLLTALRESGQRVAEAEQLVFEIENEAFFTGVSYGAAYRRVMKRRDQPALPEEQPTSDTDEADFDPFAAFEDFIAGEEDAPPHAGTKENTGRSHGRKSGGHPRKDKTQTPRLKELYRTLVRMLHPDSAKDLTDHHREVWHQVQTAYEAGDEEQLEVILALQQAESKGPPESTSLSLLQKITRRFKTALREIQGQLRKLRKDPAWKFTERKNLTALKRQFRGRLEDDVFRMNHALEHFESLLEEWKEESERTRRPRRNSSLDGFDLW